MVRELRYKFPGISAGSCKWQCHRQYRLLKCPNLDCNSLWDTSAWKFENFWVSWGPSFSRLTLGGNLFTNDLPWICFNSTTTSPRPSLTKSAGHSIIPTWHQYSSISLGPLLEGQLHLWIRLVPYPLCAFCHNDRSPLGFPNKPRVLAETLLSQTLLRKISNFRLEIAVGSSGSLYILC